MPYSVSLFSSLLNLCSMITNVPHEATLEEYLAQRELFSACSSPINYPPIGRNIPNSHTSNVINNILVDGVKAIKSDDARYWDLITWLLDYAVALLAVWKKDVAPKDGVDASILKSLRLNSAYRTYPASDVSAHQVGFAIDLTSPSLKVKALHPDSAKRATWKGWSETPDNVRIFTSSLIRYLDDHNVPYDQLGPGNNHIHIGFGRYASTRGIQLRKRGSDQLVGTSAARGQVIHEAGLVYSKQQPKAAEYCTHSNNLRELGLPVATPKSRVLQLGRQELADVVMPLLKDSKITCTLSPSVSNTSSSRFSTTINSNKPSSSTQSRPLPEMDAFGF